MTISFNDVGTFSLPSAGTVRSTLAGVSALSACPSFAFSSSTFCRSSETLPETLYSTRSNEVAVLSVFILIIFFTSGAYQNVQLPQSGAYCGKRVLHWHLHSNDSKLPAGTAIRFHSVA